MAETTKIEWADSTLNIWFGCTKVSPACDFCYAEGWAKRSGLVKWGTGETRVQSKSWRFILAKISAAALEAGRPWFVFVNSLSDFFDKEAEADWRAEALAEFRKHPHVTFLLVTKRIGNAEDMIAAGGGLPQNCAVLITVINQEEARRDVPKLLVLKARLKPAFVGVSIEPMLGHIDLTALDTMALPGAERIDALNGIAMDFLGQPVGMTPTLDWVICGFESGPKARPGHPAWATLLAAQCKATRTAFLFKQWGAWVPCQSNDGEWITDHPNFCRLTFAGDRAEGGWPMQRLSKKDAGRLLDGVTHDARPEVRHA